MKETVITLALWFGTMLLNFLVFQIHFKKGDHPPFGEKLAWSLLGPAWLILIAVFTIKDASREHPEDQDKSMKF